MHNIKNVSSVAGCLAFLTKFMDLELSRLRFSLLLLLLVFIGFWVLKLLSNPTWTLRAFNNLVRI